MTRTRQPHTGGPLPARPGHRALVYCDDTPMPWWGYWCMDCPQEQKPWTKSKQAAEKAALKHSKRTAPELVGS